MLVEENLKATYRIMIRYMQHPKEVREYFDKQLKKKGISKQDYQLLQGLFNACDSVGEDKDA